MTTTPPVVAVVEDEAKYRQALKRLLVLHDFEVLSFPSGDDFLERAAGDNIDCLLLDLHLPGKANGFGVLEALRHRPDRPVVVVMTAHDAAGHERKARQLGAAAYLLKPVDEEILVAAIGRATGRGEGGESVDSG